MYFQPNNKNKLPPCTGKFISDNLFNAIRKKQFENLGSESTSWIFLLDALDRETISPLEAYDTLKLGYLPEHLTTRTSLYTCN